MIFLQAHPHGWQRGTPAINGDALSILHPSQHLVLFLLQQHTPSEGMS